MRPARTGQISEKPHSALGVLSPSFHFSDAAAADSAMMLWGERMSGRAYTIFDTAIGRCGIAWNPAGLVGVQLPEAREIETRKRLFQLYPDARETRPSPNAEAAIEGIVALL